MSCSLPRQEADVRLYTPAMVACVLAVCCLPGVVAAQEQPAAAATDDAPEHGLLSDIKLYFTSPLRWDLTDWSLFAGTLVAVGAAHHYDSAVRSHFEKTYAPGQTVNSEDFRDAIPAAGMLVGTWGYATLIDNSDGRREAWTMLEAAGLSSVTAYALKYAVGREGPDQTSDPNEWFKGGGGSFPSWHTTAAFAVGTVLAESGDDEFRWLRRIIGYGLGAFTGYERMKHNAHWLSDTIAGAALGASSARFAMNRNYQLAERFSLSLQPQPGGALLVCRLELP
jgi:membrane-associated phospholipid phosphatase